MSIRPDTIFIRSTTQPPADSWWTKPQTREAFSAEVEKQQRRMNSSKEASQIRAMVLWSPSGAWQ